MLGHGPRGRRVQAMSSPRGGTLEDAAPGWRRGFEGLPVTCPGGPRSETGSKVAETLRQWAELVVDDVEDELWIHAEVLVDDDVA